MSWEMIFSGDFSDSEVQSYGRLIASLHALQNSVASMAMDQPAIDELATDLEAWNDRLVPLVTEEAN